MGYCLRPPCSSGLRLLMRLASLVAALLVLCVSQRASAATLAVGMCGERNESIAAPPIFRAHEPGSIVAAPCQPDVIGAGKSAPAAPERIVIEQRPERALAASQLWLARPSGERLCIDADVEILKHPGFGTSLFRPPRA
jgi:hypothetical protein